MSEPHDNAPILQTDPPGNTPAGEATLGIEGVSATNKTVAEVEHASDVGPFYTDPTFWVGVGFLIFVAVMIYLGVHKAAAKALDDRGAKIKHDLDEAARLRAEAEALLAQAEARLAGSAGDAARIVEQAQRNAREIAEQGSRDLEALIARRSKAAAERIAASERAAEAALRARTVDMATARARAVLADSDTATQTRLTDTAIAAL